MKRISFILLLILASVCFASCSKDYPDGRPEYVKIAIYDGTPQMDYFTQLLKREWKNAGHKEELQVVSWDNYAGLPENDASLLVYDGVFYSALRAKGILKHISNVPGRNSFDWTYTLDDGDEYAVPFLLCSSFLIYDRDDEVLSEAGYVTDISQEIAVPLYSMCTYYYISSLIAVGGPSAALEDLSIELDEDALAPVRHMHDNWLGGRTFEESSSSAYDGPERFRRGEVNALFNFSETLSGLSSNNMTATLLDPFPDFSYRAFNVDYISIRSGISEIESELCEELISIISSEKFQYEYLNHEGSPLYSLPADISAFTRLAGEYPLYDTFLKYSSSDINRPMVLGPDFYEQLPVLKQKVRYTLANH